ncbi:MAG: hypothetical protein ACXQTC_04390 [Methanopyraceae archaeon]
MPGARTRRFHRDLYLVEPEADTLPVFPGALYVARPPREEGIRELPETEDERGNAVRPFVALVDGPVDDQVNVDGETLRVHPEAVVHQDPDQPLVLTGVEREGEYLVTAGLPLRAYLMAREYARCGAPSPHDLFEAFSVLYDPIMAAALTLNVRGHVMLLGDSGTREHALLYTTPPDEPGPTHVPAPECTPRDASGAPIHALGDRPPELSRREYSDLLSRLQVIGGIPEPPEVDERTLRAIHERVRGWLVVASSMHYLRTMREAEEAGRLVAEVLKDRKLRRDLADAHKRAVRALGVRYPTPAYTPDARVRWARELAGMGGGRVVVKVLDFAKRVARSQLLLRLWSVAESVVHLGGPEACVDLVEMAYSYTEHDPPSEYPRILLAPWLHALGDPFYRRLERETVPPPKLELVSEPDPEDLLTEYDKLL